MEDSLVTFLRQVRSLCPSICSLSLYTFANGKLHIDWREGQELVYQDSIGWWGNPGADPHKFINLRL